MMYDPLLHYNYSTGLGNTFKISKYGFSEVAGRFIKLFCIISSCVLSKNIVHRGIVGNLINN